MALRDARREPTAAAGLFMSPGLLYARLPPWCAQRCRVAPAAARRQKLFVGQPLCLGVTGSSSGVFQFQATAAGGRHGADVPSSRIPRGNFRRRYHDAVRRLQVGGRS